MDFITSITFNQYQNITTFQIKNASFFTYSVCTSVHLAVYICLRVILSFSDDILGAVA